MAATRDSRDSATADDPTQALLRLQLFKGLGRLDLARLAGEMEDRSFSPGEVIFNQGDPPDALYIIRSGNVEVQSSAAQPALARIATLGAGEIVGEMGLVGDAPRSASAVARDYVAAWSLPKDRFLVLLEKERSIAVSVERTLASRLAETSNELLDYHQLAHGVIHWALGGPDARAQSLVTNLSLLPSWDAPVLRSHCEATGLARELDDLVAAGLLMPTASDMFDVTHPLRWRGDELPASIDLPWLRGLAAALATGHAEAAIDLLIRIGDLSHAARALESRWTSLRSTVDQMRFDRWVTALEEVNPRLRELAVQAEAGGRGGAPPLGMMVAQADQASAKAEAATRTLLSLPGKKSYGLVLAVAIYAAGWLLPVPDLIDRSALVAIGAVLASIPLLAFDVLPLLAVGTIMVLGMVVPDAVPADVALSGFASPAFMMIISLFAVSDTVGRSGLGFRLALAAHKRLPANFYVHTLVISAAGSLLTAVVSSGSARIMLAAPAMREISGLLGFRKQSNDSAAFGLLAYYSFGGLNALFVTGSVAVILIFYLLPESSQEEISWLRWFLIALVPIAVLYALVYALVVITYRPKVTNALSKSTSDFQRNLLGPMTKGETVSAAVLVFLGVGFATKDLHRIPVAWIALAALVVLVVTRLTTTSSFSRGIPWPTAFYIAVLLGLGTVFRELKIDAWLESEARLLPDALIENPYGFVTIVAGAAWLLAFFLQVRAFGPVLALIAMPLAASAGFNLLVPVLVILIAGNHAFLPALDTQYLNFYFATDGELFTHRQVRRTLQIAAILRLAVVIAAVPYFQLIGLM